MTTLKEFLKNNINMLNFEVKQTFNEKAAGATDRVIILKVPEPILTDKEKEYLGAVIKPFRNQVGKITKIKYINLEKILIIISKSKDSDAWQELIYLPYFETGTMYKGMKEGREYTLEELGLLDGQR